jgi:hypothetical protein
MDVKFITLTNEGYLDYTINCIESLKKIGNFELKCYAICSCCCEKLNNNCEIINDQENSQFQIFRRGNWANIVSYKFKIIKENLLKHDYVCITDGDIVFENPYFLEYCKKNIGDKDMLIQNDSMEDSCKDWLCSGFMFIKSNNSTLELLDFENIKEYIKPGWDDQEYINKIKNRLRCKALPLDLYPNGRYYYENFSSIKPYMIHFNWTEGHDKKKKMNLYNKWYVK